LISLSWPTRRRPEPVAADAPGASLAEMARRAEEILLDRSDQLPGRALGASDAIISRLNELQPHLDTLDPDSMLAGDARRLICQHLPRLVDSYLDLPFERPCAQREPSRRFAESLGIVAREMDDLLEQCCRDRHLSFDTQHRFIETRYRETPISRASERPSWRESQAPPARAADRPGKEPFQPAPVSAPIRTAGPLVAGTPLPLNQKVRPSTPSQLRASLNSHCLPLPSAAAPYLSSGTLTDTPVGPCPRWTMSISDSNRSSGTTISIA
jgi:hypothetical protein